MQGFAGAHKLVLEKRVETCFLIMASPASVKAENWHLLVRKIPILIFIKKNISICERIGGFMKVQAARSVYFSAKTGSQEHQ